MAKKAPENHVTGRKAVKVVESALPEGWLYRDESGTEDYGVDGTVEIVEGDVVTGQRIFVQIKGTTVLKRRANAVIFTLEVDDLVYLDDHQLPSALVVVDIKTSDLYWLDVHRYVRERIAPSNPNWRGQKTVTLSIPKRNDKRLIATEWSKLAKEGPREIATAKHGLPRWENFERLRNLTHESITAGRADHEAIKALSAGSLLQQAIHELTQGNSGRASELLARALQDARDSRDDTRLTATLKAIVLRLNPADQDENRAMFELGGEAEAAARRAGHMGEAQHIRGYILIATIYHILENLNRVHLMLKMSGDDALRTYPLKLHNEVLATRLTNVLKDYHDNLSEVLNANQFIALVDLVRSLALVELHMAKTTPIALSGADVAAIEKRSREHITAAEELARRMNARELLVDTMLVRCQIERGLDSLEVAQATLAQAKAIASDMTSARLHADLARMEQILPQLYANSKAPPWESLSEKEKDEFYRFAIERAGGQNLEDETDEVSCILKQGLMDRNPGRVLQWCSHLHMAPVVWGEPGRIFGLPTAGMKLLYCNAKNSHKVGYKLDELHTHFQEGDCVACPHRAPRREWMWTEKWQAEQPEHPEVRRLIAVYRGKPPASEEDERP